MSKSLFSGLAGNGGGSCLWLRPGIPDTVTHGHTATSQPTKTHTHTHTHTQDKHITSATLSGALLHSPPLLPLHLKSVFHTQKSCISTSRPRSVSPIRLHASAVSCRPISWLDLGGLRGIEHSNGRDSLRLAFPPPPPPPPRAHEQLELPS